MFAPLADDTTAGEPSVDAARAFAFGWTGGPATGCDCSTPCRISMLESLAAVLGGEADGVLSGLTALKRVDCDWIPARLRRGLDVERAAASALAVLREPGGLDAYIEARELLFHPDRFDPEIAVLSPCESVYVAEDPMRHARMLQSVYAKTAFVPRIAAERCCPGHIGVELEYYAHLLRAGDQVVGTDGVDTARWFLESHMLSWAPLFATVLTAAGHHVALRVAGSALESLLICETDVYRRRAAEVSLASDDGDRVPPPSLLSRSP